MLSFGWQLSELDEWLELELAVPSQSIRQHQDCYTSWYAAQRQINHEIRIPPNLLRIWPDSGLRRVLAELIEVMLEHVVCSMTGHLGLFFSNDWAL